MSIATEGDEKGMSPFQVVSLDEQGGVKTWVAAETAYLLLLLVSAVRPYKQSRVRRDTVPTISVSRWAKLA